MGLKVLWVLVSSQALKVDGEKKLNGRGSRENLSEDQMWREQRWCLRGLRVKEENNGGTSLRLTRNLVWGQSLGEYGGEPS